MKHRRVVAIFAAVALTVLSATSAYADDVYNDLDGTIDTTHESMTLFLNPGAPVTTELHMYEQSAPDHPNCNIQGDPWNLTVGADYDHSIVMVEFPVGSTFEECDDVLEVKVTPLAVGTTTVEFDYTANVPSGNNNRVFDVRQADFDVTVEEGTGDGGGTVCDAEPAAPAWAAALLKGNNVKAKGGGLANYVSTVAQEMEQRASFHGIEKIDQGEYSAEVWSYMKTLQGLGSALSKGPADVAKPGWECTQLPGTAAIS